MTTDEQLKTARTLFTATASGLSASKLFSPVSIIAAFAWAYTDVAAKYLRWRLAQGDMLEGEGCTAMLELHSAIDDVIRHMITAAQQHIQQRPSQPPKSGGMN